MDSSFKAISNYGSQNQASGERNSSKKDPVVLNQVYRTLINQLGLKSEHFEHLTSEKRQLSASEIQSREYVSLTEYNSLSESPHKVAKNILKILHFDVTNDYVSNHFKGIPGFFEDNSGWTFQKNDSFLIPYRNVKNQIIGFQTRVDQVRNDVEIHPGSLKGLQATVSRQPNFVTVMIEGEIIEQVHLEEDVLHTVTYNGQSGSIKLKSGQRYLWFSSANQKNGTGAGNPLPVHIAIPTNDLKTWESGTLHQTNSVWVTEGALKADITSEHLTKVYSPSELETIGKTVMGLPGVNTWRQAFCSLEEMGVKHVNLAFDIDIMSNSYVQNALKSFVKELKDQGYTASLAIWNEKDGKGIDDLLINKRFPQLKKII